MARSAKAASAFKAAYSLSTNSRLWSFGGLSFEEGMMLRLGFRPLVDSSCRVRQWVKDDVVVFPKDAADFIKKARGRSSS